MNGHDAHAIRWHARRAVILSRDVVALRHTLQLLPDDAPPAVRGYTQRKLSTAQRGIESCASFVVGTLQRAELVNVTTKGRKQA